MGNNNDNTPRDEARPRLTIADWAEDDRPREKLALRGRRHCRTPSCWPYS